MRLFVVCKACRSPFALPVVGGPFGRPLLGETAWTCPRCGERRVYATDDHLAGGAPGRARRRPRPARPAA